jgi:hypothetical protein
MEFWTIVGGKSTEPFVISCGTGGRHLRISVRIGAHDGMLSFQLTGHPFIVGIEERDKFSSRLRDPLVACIRRPETLGNSNDPNSGVLEPGEFGIQIIGRTVIDNDQLEFSGRLNKYARYGAGNCFCAVIDGDYHGNIGGQKLVPLLLSLTG